MELRERLRAPRPLAEFAAFLGGGGDLRSRNLFALRDAEFFVESAGMFDRRLDEILLGHDLPPTEPTAGVITLKLLLLTFGVIQLGRGDFAPALRAVAERVEEIEPRRSGELPKLLVELGEAGGFAEVNLAPLEIRLEGQNPNFLVLRPRFDDIEGHRQVSVLGLATQQFHKCRLLPRDLDVHAPRSVAPDPVQDFPDAAEAGGRV